MRGRRAIPLVRHAVGYVRVNLVNLADDISSLDAQAERVIAHAQAIGLPLRNVIRDDGRSDFADCSQQLEAILTDIRAGKISSVVIMGLDVLPLCDLAAIMEKCRKHDCALVSASESVRLRVTVLGVVTQFIRETIAERNVSTSRMTTERAQ